REVDDDVDVGIGEQLVDAAAVGNAVLAGGGAGEIDVEIRAGDDLKNIVAAAAGDVGAADFAATDDADAKFLGGSSHGNGRWERYCRVSTLVEPRQPVDFGTGRPDARSGPTGRPQQAEALQVRPETS